MNIKMILYINRMIRLNLNKNMNRLLTKFLTRMILIELSLKSIHNKPLVLKPRKLLESINLQISRIMIAIKLKLKSIKF